MKNTCYITFLARAVILRHCRTPQIPSLAECVKELDSYMCLEHLVAAEYDKLDRNTVYLLDPLPFFLFSNYFLFFLNSSFFLNCPSPSPLYSLYVLRHSSYAFSCYYICYLQNVSSYSIGRMQYFAIFLYH